MNEFLDEIRAAGYEPPDSVEPGRFHRYPGLNKPKGNTAGYCYLYTDRGGGFYGDWCTENKHYWFADSIDNLSEKDRDRYRQEAKEAQLRNVQERKEAHQGAAIEAKRFWDSAEPATDHEYLKRKGIQAHGTRQRDGWLLVPIRDGDAITSIQRIDPDGNKRFWPSGKISGCYFLIGNPTKVIYLVEGFATGASVYEATGEAVAVAFNASNLKPVSEALAGLYSSFKSKVAADNDESKAGEIAARETGLEVLLPPEIGDWNDYHKKHGLEAVTKQLEPSSSLSLFDQFKVSDEEMAQISDPEFIIDGLVVSSQLQVVCAEAGAGKTTIFFHLAEQMVEKEYRVFYVHADTGAGDAKYYHRKAKDYGIDLLLPTLKTGMSMDDVVGKVKMLSESGENLSKVVFIFDTYKKMTEVMSKTANKKMMTLLRGLTGKSATVILLHHTNKYEVDGKPMFEGTGDVRNDPDMLTYLIPDKRPDGKLAVSTMFDKKRFAGLQEMTFHISPNREVTVASEYQDLLMVKQQRDQLAKDQETVERITEAMMSGPAKQCDIVKYCKGHEIGARTVAACLKRYRDGNSKKWDCERTRENNAAYYRLTAQA